ATRRVVAEQHGRTIFTMMASFHASEAEPFTHQRPMPPAPDPAGLSSDVQQRRALASRLPPTMQRWALAERPVEYRDVAPLDPLAPRPGPAEEQTWVRAVAPLPDDPLLHRALLAYASDFGLLRAALRPHGLTFLRPDLQAASLDHAMWFHRDFRVDDWLLYSVDSPSAQGARALCRGELYSRDGRLVASVAQEGLLRLGA
ncbi:MAG: acyl-CoA thioesterase II, partial [Burkholderiales bacterium]